MAPSQTRVVLAGLSGQRIHEEAFAFWDEIYGEFATAVLRAGYSNLSFAGRTALTDGFDSALTCWAGFDMSAMKPSRFEEAIVDIVDAEEIATTEQVIQSIDCHIATVASLDFVAPFALTATSTSRPIRAFVSWFDTFFASTSGPEGQAPDALPVDLEVIPDDALQRPVVTGAGGNDLHSFTTGPHGKPTHWKQVVFYLSQPIELDAEQRIEGTFHLRKQKENLRELAVEIHFRVVDQAGKEVKPMRYEVFKVT